MSDERKTLEKLRQDRERLAAAEKAARLQAEYGDEQVRYLQTPAGAASCTDKEAEAAFIKVRSLHREYARAQNAVIEFDAAAGRNLEAQFQDLERREGQSRYAELDARIEKWIHQMLGLFNQVLAVQNEGAELFRARGYRNPLPPLITEKAIAEWRYALCPTHRHLLEPDDPQRCRWEGERGLLPEQKPERIAAAQQEEAARIAHVGGIVPMAARAAAD